MSKRNIVIIVAVLAVCAVAGIGYYMYDQDQKRIALEKKIREETLIVAFDKMPQTLNPLFEQNTPGLTLLDPIFDGLANRSGLKIPDYQDGLAIDFLQDEEKHNIYVVELNQDKRWHDAPDHMVTARDVRFTYECIINENNRSPLRGRINQLIKRIEIIDNFTVRIVFKEDINRHVVRDLLAFKIIPSVYKGKAMSVDLRTDAVAQEFAKDPVGTGDFRFAEWQGNRILYTRATQPSTSDDEEEEEEEETEAGGEQSVQRKIILQSIEATLVHDREKQVRMLIDGKVDLILETPTNLHSMLNEKGLKHAEYVPLHFYAVAFNTVSPNFSSKIVRRALALAVNKTELAQLVWSGDVSGLINKGPFPHNDDKRYRKFKDLLSFDLNKAKKLIKNKSGFTAALIYQEDPANTMKRLAGKIAVMASELGITVEAKGIGRAFETQLSNKTYDLALIRHSGFADGYNIAGLYRSNSPRNITGTSNEKLDKQFDTWENSAFWETRLPAGKKLHRTLLDLSPYIYLFSLPTSAYYSPRLKNLTIVDPNALLGAVSEWSAVAP